MIYSSPSALNSIRKWRKMNGKIEVGTVCFSKAGHDKGDAFIIVESGEEYAFVADGKRRKLAKPKKKKYIHLQLSNIIITEIKEKLISGTHLMDADIKKALEKYERS